MPEAKGGTKLAKSQAKGNKSKNTTARTKAGSTKPAVTAADIIAEKKGRKMRPIFYIASFLIPFLLTFVSYIGFDVYPFGERSVLTLDLNGQYIYYFEALRKAFWGDGSFFYSWSRNLSGGFMGIIGYYLASPFTLIVMLLPRKMILESVMIMQMTKVGAAGLTFCIYAQKSKSLRPLQSVMFSTMYAMMAYVVIQLIDPMWIDGPIFLPLIVLGIEYLVDDGRKVNYIIPTAIMFVANFYIGYMIAIFIALYFFYYVFFGTERKFKGFGDYFMVFVRMGISTVVVLMLSFIMIMPVYNALALGKFDFSGDDIDYSYKAMFNPLELVPCMLPNQYYSVNVDTGTLYYGRPEIYCGVLTFVLLPLFFINKKIKVNKKIGYGLLTFILLFSMYVKPINMMWHGGQDPNWLPYRYSFLLSFVFVSMAADIFSRLDGYKMSPASVCASGGVIGVLTLTFCALMDKFNYSQEKYPYVAILPYKDKMNRGSDSWNEIWLGTIAFGMILGAIYLIGVYCYSHSKTSKAKNAITVAMACLIFFETGYNCFDSFRKIFKEVGNSDRSTYTDIITAPNIVKELKEYDGGFYRAEKTFNRMVNDDLAYGLKGISHSSSVMNTRAIKFIEAMGYFTQSFESKYEGCNPVADSILGIKYVLDDPDRTNISSMVDASYIKRLTYSYTRDKNRPATMDIYENPNALGIGFMADDDVLYKLTGIGNDNPFNSLNYLLTAIAGTSPSPDELQPKQYYVPFDCDIHYDDSKVYLHDYNSNGWIHDCYEAFAGVDDAVVNVDVTVPHDGDIYMHLGSEIRRQINVWAAVKGPDGVYRGQKTGDERFDGYGTYFTTNSSPIVRMGPFKEGDQVEIRLTIPPSGENGRYDGSDEYIMIRKDNGFNFYYLDEEAFQQDIEKLKAQPWDLDMTQTNDRYLVGDIDAQEGQVLMTTIPYEPGWEIQIDGRTVKSQIIEEKTIKKEKVTVAGKNGKTKQKTKKIKNVKIYNSNGNEGEVILVGTLIGIRVPAGHHTVSMKYTPPGFNTGVLTLILGVILLVLFYLYDRKHNKILTERIKAKKLLKNGEAEKLIEEEKKASKKKPDIIKSKGAIAAEPLKKSKVNASDAEDEAEEAVTEAAGKAEEAAGKIKDAAEDIKEKAEDIVEDVKEKAENVAEDVKEKAEDIAEDIADKAGEAAGEAAEKAEKAADNVKNAVKNSKNKSKKN